MPPLTTTTELQGWIDRLHKGDEAARDQLINSCCKRVRLLTRKMLKRYPRVKRWEETDDVLQNVTLRLSRTLEQVTPAGVRDFLRLASLNIRRELLDLVKHYYGPQGMGAHHTSQYGLTTTSEQAPYQQGDLRHEPAQLAQWSEFHEKIESLPDEERELFDLLWYQGLSQLEAAEVLGVSERTVQRRWQSARLRLIEKLDGNLPPID